MNIKNFVSISIICSFACVYNIIFNNANSLIGIGIIIALLSFKNIDLGFKKLEASIFIFIALNLSVILPYISMFSIIFGFILNFTYIYYITIISSKHMTYKAQIAFVLLYIFAESNPVETEFLLLRIISMLLFSTLIALLYYHNRVDDINNLHIKDLLTSHHPHKINLALRFAICISLAMCLSSVFDLYKHMWFTITMMSLVQYNPSNNTKKIITRILFCLLGLVLYLILFVLFIPNYMLFYTIMLISYIYSYIKGHDSQMIFITVSALLSNEIFFTASVNNLITRCCLILLGVFVTYIFHQIDIRKSYK